MKKTEALARSGALIYVIHPKIESAFSEKFSNVKFFHRAARNTDFREAKLAVIATEDPAMRDQLVAMARTEKTLVNVVDQPEFCDWTMPAIIDRGPVTIAISTSGNSPVLARILREKIEAILPERITALAQFCAKFRPLAKENGFGGSKAKNFWEKILRGTIGQRVLAGNEAAAQQQLCAQLKAGPDKQVTLPGHVKLVGAGPGDPDLLTLKALQAISTADIIFHDRLVSSAILNRARRDAVMVDVGKRSGGKSTQQQVIQVKMLEAVRGGKQVVRLKGGDPFLFGRGGEELAYLHSHGITVEIIPGITAALGCAASHGIALTHRDHAQALILATGHHQGDLPKLDWGSFAGAGKTLCIYMGVHAAPKLSEELISAAISPSLPVTIIENGTLPNEKSVTTCIGKLATDIKTHNVSSPALLIIGQVAQASAIASLAATLETDKQAAA